MHDCTDKKIKAMNYTKKIISDVGERVFPSTYMTGFCQVLHDKPDLLSFTHLKFNTDH